LLLGKQQVCLITQHIGSLGSQRAVLKYGCGCADWPGRSWCFSICPEVPDAFNCPGSF